MSLDMPPYITLDICIDSESINSVSQSSKDIVDRLLLYHKNECSCYNFVRSAYDSSPNIVSEIPEVQYSKLQEGEQKVKTIAKYALKNSRLSEGEKSFLLSIYNYSGLSKTGSIMETGHNIKDKVYVTENENFLSRRYSLESFFPGIRLVYLQDCLDIMDLFAKTQNLFLRSPNANANMNKGYWYWIYFRWKVPHYNVLKPSSLIGRNDILHALGKRICYLLIAVDELGKLHHFNCDDEIMILYHFNYILSLITGVFDNLAIYTQEKYGIRLPPTRISLKNGDFLDEVQNHDAKLRNHIRSNNDFITLIHKLRDKVIHAEGLKEMGVFFDFKISTFVPISKYEEGIIRSCGDKIGPYRKLTEWGVYKVPNNITDFYLIPYFFAKSATRLLLKFADEYLELDGHKKYLNQEINAFQRLSLRGVER
jgi:hypothetical protein